MGVTRLEVYNFVYNVPPTNNKLYERTNCTIQKIVLIDQQLKVLGIDTHLVMIKFVQQGKSLYMVKFTNFKYLINKICSKS